MRKKNRKLKKKKKRPRRHKLEVKTIVILQAVNIDLVDIKYLPATIKNEI